jgi:LysR family glycine cleavage system transcriptional activator
MSLNLPPLTTLRTFESVARLLSVRLAARELGVTASAVRLSLRTLEHYVGRRLLERRGNTLSLSEAGAAFYGTVSESFRQLADATSRLTAVGDETLRLSVAPSVASRWLLPRLPRFQERYPDIVIAMSTSLRLVDFAHENVDVGIRFGRGAWPDLHCRPITPSSLVAVTSPELLEARASAGSSRGRSHAGFERLPNSALGTLPILEVSSAPQEWELFCAAARVDRRSLHRAMIVDTVQLALQAAEAGMGVALSRPLLVADALRRGRLCAPFAIEARADTTYYFAGLPNTLASKTVSAFSEWLFEEAERTHEPLDS